MKYPRQQWRFMEEFSEPIGLPGRFVDGNKSKSVSRGGYWDDTRQRGPFSSVTNQRVNIVVSRRCISSRGGGRIVRESRITEDGEGQRAR